MDDLRRRLEEIKRLAGEVLDSDYGMEVWEALDVHGYVDTTIWDDEAALTFIAAAKPEFVGRLASAVLAIFDNAQSWEDKRECEVEHYWTGVRAQSRWTTATIAGALNHQEARSDEGVDE